MNGSELTAKGVLDGGANPPISTNQYQYSDREWERVVGWGKVPTERSTGMNSFDRASNNLAATREATDVISAN